MRGSFFIIALSKTSPILRFDATHLPMIGTKSVDFLRKWRSDSYYTLMHVGNLLIFMEMI
jgi:hypothetical protein